MTQIWMDDEVGPPRRLSYGDKPQPCGTILRPDMTATEAWALLEKRLEGRNIEELRLGLERNKPKCVDFTEEESTQIIMQAAHAAKCELIERRKNGS